MSAIFRVAERVPESSELKVTVMLQLVPTAIDDPHPLVNEKSSLSVPFAIETLVMFTVELPTLDRVTVCDAVLPDDTVPKLTLLGEMLIAGCVTTRVTCLLAVL